MYEEGPSNACGFAEHHSAHTRWRGPHGDHVYQSPDQEDATSRARTPGAADVLLAHPGYCCRHNSPPFSTPGWRHLTHGRTGLMMGTAGQLHLGASPARAAQLKHRA